MPLTVPAQRRAYNSIPAAGDYDAQIVSAKEEPEGNYQVTWQFTARDANFPEKPEGSFDLDSHYDEESMGDLLLDVGMEPGQEVDLADLNGRRAKVTVRTTGGKTGAKITAVQHVA